MKINYKLIIIKLIMTSRLIKSVTTYSPNILKTGTQNKNIDFGREADMPLAVRYVEPKHLCKRPLPEGTKNELNAVAVLSLAGAIRQISSLAKHAESLMGEICDTLSDYNRRSLALQERVTRLKRRITRFDYDAQKECKSSL